MAFTTLLLLLLTIPNTKQAKLKSCSEDFETLQLCQSELKPNYPISVKSRLEIRDVIDINEEDKSLTVYLYAFFSWNNNQVSIKGPNGTANEEWIEISQNDGDIFKPRLAFLNVLSLTKIGIIGEDQFRYFWLKAPHYFEYAELVQVTIVCPFRFPRYPFDSHECNLAFQSSLFSVRTLILDPPEVNLQVNEGMQRLPFTIYLQEHKTWDPILSNGYNYSVAGVQFVLIRNSLGPLMGGFYLPTGTFAFLTMISFHIDPDIVPGRMGLLVTLFLISVNVYSSVAAPKDRGMSFIEIWMLGTQMPIALAILEYGYILYLKRAHEKKNKNLYQVSSANESTQTQDEELLLIKKIRKYDDASFIFSFCYFVSFLIAYCATALALSF